MRRRPAWLLLLLSPATAAAQVDPNQRAFSEAVRLDSTGRHAQAVRILDRLSEVPGWEYKALLRRGIIRHQHLGQHQLAVSDLGRAARIAPDSAAPWLNRGSVYLELGMPDRALADTEEGLKRCRSAEDSASAYLNLGVIHAHTRRFELALQAYDRSLALQPDDWATLMNKATVLDDLGRADEARAIFLRLHEQRPGEVPIMNNLGFQASNQGDHAEALRWFEKACALRPDDPVVLNNLGYAQHMAGRHDEALRSVQRSIKLYPANSYAHRNLGLIWLAKGDKAKACDAFEEALRRGFTQQYGPEVDRLRKERCAP